MHGDFAEWNVHYDGDRLAGVLDFELTHLDSRPYELMSAPSDIVTAYLTAFTSGDLDQARALVSDGFSFQGPRGGADGGDAFIAASEWIVPYLRGVRILRQWEDGEDVSTL